MTDNEKQVFNIKRVMASYTYIKPMYGHKVYIPCYRDGRGNIVWEGNLDQLTATEALAKAKEQYAIDLKLKEAADAIRDAELLAMMQKTELSADIEA